MRSSLSGGTKPEVVICTYRIKKGREAAFLMVLNFRGGSMSAGEIAARFACRWPTTTRHLRVLQQASLVRVEKRGRRRIYQLNVSVLHQLLGQWLSWFPQKPKGSQGKRAT